MADASPSFEQADLLGTTSTISGSVNTAFVAVPVIASGVIAELLLDVPQSGNSSNSYIEISFDGGVSSFRVNRGSVLSWNLKGYLSQVHLKGSTSGVNYQLLLNREPV